ncbi:hypothetical protein HYR99_13635 [Candidatus Poribacteria bacterium]|nr:hypothetical protein [Candidatus Poribacteria bacterium]
MKETFQIIPASSGPIWFFVGLATFFLALLTLFGYLAYSSRHVKFEVSPEGFRISGDLYGRQIPLKSLILDRAKSVDLNRDKDYQLKRRTNGTGLPGYRAGWFKLRNGEKCLVFVTDKRRVLYLPTRQGYSVLLSVKEPDSLLDALREAASRDAAMSG